MSNSIPLGTSRGLDLNPSARFEGKEGDVDTTANLARGFMTYVDSFLEADIKPPVKIFLTDRSCINGEIHRRKESFIGSHLYELRDRKYSWELRFSLDDEDFTVSGRRPLLSV